MDSSNFFTMDPRELELDKAETGHSKCGRGLDCFGVVRYTPRSAVFRSGMHLIFMSSSVSKHNFRLVS